MNFDYALEEQKKTISAEATLRLAGIIPTYRPAICLMTNGFVREVVNRIEVADVDAKQAETILAAAGLLSAGRAT